MSKKTYIALNKLFAGGKIVQKGASVSLEPDLAERYKGSLKEQAEPVILEDTAEVKAKAEAEVKAKAEAKAKAKAEGGKN